MSRTKLEYDLRVNVTGGREIGSIVAQTRALREETNLVTAAAQKQGVMTRSQSEAAQEGVRVLDAQNRAMDKVRKTMDPLTKGHRLLTNEIKKNAQSVRDLTKTSKELDITTVQQNTRMERRERLIKKNSDTTNRLSLDSKRLVTGLKNESITLADAEKEYIRLNNAAQRVLSTNQKLAERVGITTAEQNKLKQQNQRVTKEMDDLRVALSRSKNTLDEQTNSVADLVGRLGHLRSEMRSGTGIAALQEAQYSSLKQEYKTLNSTLQRLINSQNVDAKSKQELIALNTRLNNAMTSTSRTQAGVAEAFTGTTKVTNSANQILLSFGDILQDSSQFQYGFALGMRAIGNNITFAAEQFTILAAKIAAQNDGVVTGRKVMQSLVKSFTGVGGLIIAINLAVTAITIFSEKMRRAKKEALDTKDSIDIVKEAFKDYADAIEELGRREEKSRMQIEYEKVGSELLAIQAVLKDIGNVEDELAKAREERAGIASRFETVVGFDDLGQPMTMDLEAPTEAEKEAIRVQDQKIARLEREAIQVQSLTTRYEELIAQQKVLNQQEQIAKRFEEQIGPVPVVPDDKKEDDSARKEAQRLLDLDFRKAVSATTDAYRDEVEKQRQLFSIRSRFLDRSLEENLIMEDEYHVAVAELRTEALQFEYEIDRDLRKRRTEAMDEMSRLEASQAKEGMDRIKSEYENELSILQRQLADKILLQEEYDAAVAQIDYNKAQREKDLREASFEADRKAYQDLAQIALGGAQLIFGKSKALAIAETLISTYFSAQKAFESQVKAAVDPASAFSAPVRGALAAGAAIVQGLARVQQIRKTTLGGGGGGATSQGTSQPSFGFQMNAVEGPQTFRTPSFVPNGATKAPETPVTVEILASRRDLYYVVKRGEEEALRSQV